MELIDRLRKDIQHRLDALLSEADKLRQALVALDPRGSSQSGTSSARPATGATRPATRATRPGARATRPAARATRPGARAPSSGAAGTSRRSRRRTPPGATKRQVVDALSDGSSKTAGEVAAETGLARGTVSTTLSKLARGGEVVKAERGYRLPSRPGSAAGSASGEEAPSVDGPQSGERSRSDGDAASSPSS